MTISVVGVGVFLERWVNSTMYPRADTEDSPPLAQSGNLATNPRRGIATPVGRSGGPPRARGYILTVVRPKSCRYVVLHVDSTA